MKLGDLDALKKSFALLMWKEHNPHDTVKACDIVNQILDLIDNAPTVKPETMRLSLIDNIRQKNIAADKAWLEGYKKGKNARPQGDPRDNLKEIFREAAKIKGDIFYLYEIEKIIDGEPWM